MRIGEAVPGPPAVRYRLNEATPAQARQLIGHHLPRYPERIREIRVIRGRLAKRQKDTDPGRIRQCMTEPSQRCRVID